MKILALHSIIVSLLISSVSGQSQSDVEFLRARADAHERKIIELEKDLSRLKALLSDKSAATVTAKSNATADTLPKAVSNNSTINYVVKPGDVLSRIATAHESTVNAICKENKLSNDRIMVGQRLRIPVADASTAALESSAKTNPPVAKKSLEHRVQSGETFYSIARIHNVSIESLKAANPNVIPTKMYVGQTLHIDGNAKQKAKTMVADQTHGSKKHAKHSAAVAAAKSQPLTSTSNASSKESEPVANKKSSEPKIKTITVDDQITYGQFASRHGASTTQLNELNGLSLSGNTTLAKGSELYVPQF